MGGLANEVQDAQQHDLCLGVAAVARLLEQPAASINELAARLDASPAAVARALQARSIAPLVVRDRRGTLRAAVGATSATLPLARRRALAARVGPNRPR